MKLRDIFKMNYVNDGTRSLNESIAIPEVASALNDWKKATGDIGVLIGGCAVSYYVRPRGTTDVDFLFLSNHDIPNEVPGFKRTRNGAFQHNITHVEIEVITAESVGLSPILVKKVFETAQLIDGLHIASPAGLVALKLRRMKRYDAGDIEALIESCNIDFAGWPISEEDINTFNKIKSSVQ